MAFCTNYFSFCKVKKRKKNQNGGRKSRKIKTRYHYLQYRISCSIYTAHCALVLDRTTDFTDSAYNCDLSCNIPAVLRKLFGSTDCVQRDRQIVYLVSQSADANAFRGRPVCMYTTIIFVCTKLPLKKISLFWKI